MTDNRKDIRFKLPASCGADFDSAKRRAENELGVSMTSNEFARRVVVQAVRGAWHDHSVINKALDWSSDGQPEQETGTRNNQPRRPFLDGGTDCHEDS